MKTALSLVIVFILLTTSLFAQGFNVKADGEQTFSFTDESGKSQTSFFSETPLEDIKGISNHVKGSVTFNVNDFTTLSGKITVPVSSIQTGISLRDRDLQSAAWLNANDYPDITFEITGVSNIKQVSDNKITADVTGKFSVHGVTKEVTAGTTITYLDENEQTRQRGPGDLLGVQSVFNIKLSDFGISNKLIGQKVAEDVVVSVNIVGTNAGNFS